MLTRSVTEEMRLLGSGEAVGGTEAAGVSSENARERNCHILRYEGYGKTFCCRSSYRYYSLILLAFLYTNFCGQHKAHTENKQKVKFGRVLGGIANFFQMSSVLGICTHYYKRDEKKRYFMTLVLRYR